MGTISTVDNNFLHCYKNTQHNVLRFGSKLLPSSGKIRIPETQLTKNITLSTHNITIYTHLNYDDMCVIFLVLAMFQSDTSLHLNEGTQRYVRYSFDCLLVQS